MLGYIYRIIAPGSKCVYVGQSVNPTMRFYQHKSLARLGKGDNPGLRNFLLKHPDAEMYSWPVLDMDAEEIADERECRALGFRVLNVLPTGSRPPSQKGRIPWNKGKKCGPSWNKGKKATPELREKLRASHLGVKPSPESNAKRSATLTGHKQSAETVAKRSASLTGRSLSAEHCARISAVQKGRKRSAESVTKTATALRGRKQSPESNAKRSASHKKRWATHASN